MATVANNSQLYVKSYFAASIEEAMEQARVELGPDALLLNMRDAPPEGRHLGQCEAVFGTRPAPALVKCVPEAPVDPVADSNGLFHGLGDHAENSFSVDGQPITDQQSKVFSNQLPMEAVQSMEVIEGAPPAEYGDKTSLVIDVTTRSGQGVTRRTAA